MSQVPKAPLLSAMGSSMTKKVVGTVVIMGSMATKRSQIGVIANDGGFVSEVPCKMHLFVGNSPLLHGQCQKYR